MNRKKAILTAASVILCLLLTACTDRAADNTYQVPEEKKLIVYTSHKKHIYEPIIKEFEERSGIFVEIRTGGTNELLEKLENQEHSMQGDIFFGGGVDSLEVYHDYFIPYRSSQSEKLYSTYASSDDTYTVFSRIPIVFVYNTKLVIQAGRPRSFEELLESRWDGKIAFADPDKSGSSYTALLTMIQVLSPKYSPEEVVTQFCNNLNYEVSDDSATVIDDVVSGKKLVGITFEETALNSIADGKEIGIVYPEEGTSAVPDGCAILKDAKHIENARLFIEFIVSEDVQQYLEDQLNRTSVRTDIKSKSSMVEIPYDLTYSREHRQEILQKWRALACIPE